MLEYQEDPDAWSLGVKSVSSTTSEPYAQRAASISAHPAEREVAVGRIDEQVVVVVHQTVGVAGPVVAPCDVLEGVQECDAVLVAPVDGLLLIAARGDVVDGAGVFDPKGSCHATGISEQERPRQTLKT